MRKLDVQKTKILCTYLKRKMRKQSKGEREFYIFIDQGLPMSETIAKYLTDLDLSASNSKIIYVSDIQNLEEEK